MLVEDIIVRGVSGKLLQDLENESRVDRGDTKCRPRPGVEVEYCSRTVAVDVGDTGLPIPGDLAE